MAGFHRWPLTLVVGVTLMTVTASGSHASPILDQSQTNVGTNLGSCGGGSPSFTICGQLFTVGLTGTLTSIDFYLNNAVGTPEAGIYTGITGSIVLLAQTSPTVLAFGGPGFYSFVFNHPVSAGEQLYFGLRQDDGDGIDWPTNGSDPYGPGQAFVFHSIGSFLPLSSDAAFRTFVDTGAAPEPTSLALIGLGLAGIGARRWRQRKQP